MLDDQGFLWGVFIDVAVHYEMGGEDRKNGSLADDGVVNDTELTSRLYVVSWCI